MTVYFEVNKGGVFMHFLCSNKKEVERIKIKYIKLGKWVKISNIKNNVFIGGKMMKYEVEVGD